MLEPDNRTLLFDALRPPAGYQLDAAVGTTYSLDLLTLVTVPLAFTLFDWQTGDAHPTSDPIALLEALRRNAGRIVIFCQAGQISVPTVHQTLFGYLEDSVVEVAPRSEAGVFHPKVWLLRYQATPDALADEPPVRYRLLVMSRNLTFDRSWDVLLTLDGVLTERANAFGLNHPLGDFVAALPTLAVRDPADWVTDTIDRLQHEVRRVKFDPPEGLEIKGFWPLGLKRSQAWPFAGRIDRLLVISPFLSEGCLERLTAQGSGHVLVSQPDSLAAIDASLRERFARQLVLVDAATPEPTDDGLQQGDAGDDLRAEPCVDDFSHPLSGLHAKIYVADAGWDARIWVGSANATEMAFGGNVEFLVELSGRKSRFGVDAILSPQEGSRSLIELLEEYRPETDTPDELQEDLERALDALRRAVAQLPLRLAVAGGEEPETYALQLWQVEPHPVPVSGEDEIEIAGWPITLSEAAARGIVPVAAGDGPQVVATFPALSLAALSPFFAFRVTLHRQGRSVSTRFVRNLPLDGAPPDRRDRILRSILRDRDHVIRYLLLLLSEGGYDFSEVVALSQRLVNRNGRLSGGDPGIPLLEALLRALARRPDRLDPIARLVAELARDPDGAALFPEGFEEIWSAIWNARKESRTCRSG